MYKEPQNNPAIPNEAKQAFAQRMGDAQPNQGGQAPTGKQLINFQLYAPPAPPKPNPQVNPVSFFPSFATNPFYPPHLANQMNPFNQYMMSGMGGMAMGGFPTVNLNKVYDIKVGGPADTHHQLNMIYEDILPTKHIKTSFSSLGDRLAQSNYVRTILFPNGDGDEVGFDGSSKNSLLAHIKFLDLNPYNTYRFSDNPYRGLPDGYLIYRSCYPIQRDERDGMTVCSKNSMAVNLRIYKLTKRAYDINSQNKSSYQEFEQWRDVGYYEYIREHIVKRKMCPNFVSMHGFYLTQNSCIDFDKVSQLRINVQPKQTSFGMKQSSQLDQLSSYKAYAKNDQENLVKLESAMKNVVGPNIGNYTQPINLVPQLVQISHPDEKVSPIVAAATLKAKQKLLDDNAAKEEALLDTYAGQTLTVMTESPTYNLYNWASKIHIVEGNIKKMVNTGYHSEQVWFSILFQLAAALYTMQLKSIYINNFSIRNNVFIKDLSSESNVTNYWKYKINNIEYYIPNYGYLLVIDSSYIDLKDAQPAQLIPTKLEHKIDGLIYDPQMNLDVIKTKCFNMFTSAFDSNVFKGEFLSEGGAQPPSDVLNLLNKISSSTNSGPNDISMYILEHFTMFMNNRIGTYLKQTELEMVRKDDMRNAKVGQMIVMDEGNQTFKFVLYLKTNSNQTATVLSKEDSSTDVIQKDVSMSLLYNYSRHEPIVQTYKMNEANLTEEAIIESYNII
jgi:hypothetical protein